MELGLSWLRYWRAIRGRRARPNLAAMLEGTGIPFFRPNKPRYLMGVEARAEDLVNGVLRGIDIFDCVLPTRPGAPWCGHDNGRAS